MEWPRATIHLGGAWYGAVVQSPFRKLGGGVPATSDRVWELLASLPFR